MSGDVNAGFCSASARGDQLHSTRDLLDRFVLHFGEPLLVSLDFFVEIFVFGLHS